MAKRMPCADDETEDDGDGVAQVQIALQRGRNRGAHRPNTVSALVWKKAFLSCALMAMASCAATSSGWY
jgi:hypothetical protein